MIASLYLPWGCSLTKMVLLAEQMEGEDPSHLHHFMNDVSTYLHKLITDQELTALSEEDKKKIQLGGMEAFIFDVLNNSNFKASAMPETLEVSVKENIKQSVSEGRPIHVTVPFGGYKKWQLPTYPYPDWSEIFNIIQLRTYLMPIARAYEHGVILEYYSDEIFVSRMNNILQEDLDLYTEHFEKLVEYFQQHMPDNFQIKLSKIRDQITSEELHRRFDKIIDELRDDWENVPQKDQQYRLTKAARNYKGDLDSLSKDERESVLLESSLVHDAFIYGDWREGVPWAFDRLMIPVGFRYTGDWGIHLKSSRSSTVQFWVGLGALVKKGDEYLPTILTYEQYLSKKDDLIEEGVDGFLQDNPNYTNIYLIE